MVVCTELSLKITRKWRCQNFEICQEIQTSVTRTLTTLSERPWITQQPKHSSSLALNVQDGVRDMDFLSAEKGILKMAKPLTILNLSMHKHSQWTSRHACNLRMLQRGKLLSINIFAWEADFQNRSLSASVFNYFHPNVSGNSIFLQSQQLYPFI